MAIRNILKEDDGLLLKKSRTVEVFDQRLHMLLDDMVDTMKDADGCGLAAPQVGILRRAVVIDVGEGVTELVNPEIVSQKGLQEAVEGCLSSPGEYGITKRPKSVKVKALDRYGKSITIKGEDLLARALCHEIDHLDGVLFKTHVIRMVDESEIEAQNEK